MTTLFYAPAKGYIALGAPTVLKALQRGPFPLTQFITFFDENFEIIFKIRILTVEGMVFLLLF